jgi:hypothetical protein
MPRRGFAYDADRVSAPTRRIGGNDGPGLVTTQPGFGARHDQLTNAAFAAWFGACQYAESKRKPRW